MRNVLNLIKINFISIFKGMFGFNKKRKGASFLATAIFFLPYFTLLLEAL